LKPSFNDLRLKLPGSAPENAPRDRSRRKKTGFVMATIVSGSLRSPTRNRSGRPGSFAEIRAFWRQFFAKAFDPYRPELHYMRGPGPACRAKHAASRRRTN
jgi:hypothetical protein